MGNYRVEMLDTAGVAGSFDYRELLRAVERPGIGTISITVVGGAATPTHRPSAQVIVTVVR